MEKQQFESDAESYESRSEDLSKSASSKDSNMKSILNSLESNAIQKINESNFEKAIKILRKTEDMLEIMTTEGSLVVSEKVLAVLHNLASCYQSNGFLEKSAAYLDACLFNVNSLKAMKNNRESIAYEIKKLKYIGTVQIQMCAVLSRLGKHKEAIKHARAANKSIMNVVKLLISASKSQEKKVTSCRRKNYELSEQQLRCYNNISLVKPTLKSIEKYLTTGRINEPQQIRTALGVKHYPEWVKTYSIADVMIIKPVTARELRSSSKLYKEYTNDSLVHVVCLLAVSYFCMGTELKYLQTTQPFDFKSDNEIEQTQLKSQELLNAFVPPNCPLLNHINESHQSRFKENLQEIVRAT